MTRAELEAWLDRATGTKELAVDMLAEMDAIPAEELAEALGLEARVVNDVKEGEPYFKNLRGVIVRERGRP